MNSNFSKYVGLAHTPRSTPVFIAAKGSYLTDENGRKYIDLCLGRGSLPLGHGDQVVQSMTLWQMQNQVIHPSYRTSDTSPITQYAMALALRFNALPQFDTLLETKPHNQVAFMEPGRTPFRFAVEASRDYTGRDKIGLLEGATTGLDGAILINPFSTLAEDGLDDLPWEDMAAVVVELVQVDNGAQRLPVEFLAALRQRCRQEGTLLVVDETFTGFGRTGRMFAQETYGVTADITILGGALGGGLPLGAVVTDREIFDHVDPIHAEEVAAGGSLMACSAGLITMTQITEGVLRNARQVAVALEDGLRTIEKDFPTCVRRVEVNGMLASVEFTEDFAASSAQEVLSQHGALFCDDRATSRSVLTLFPALNMERRDLRKTLKGMWDACHTASLSPEPAHQ